MGGAGSMPKGMEQNSYTLTLEIGSSAIAKSSNFIYILTLEIGSIAIAQLPNFYLFTLSCYGQSDE